MEDHSILQSIERQYRASLAMLGEAIERCPESLWIAEEHKNRYWHVAYHAVFYTHFYLHPTEGDFRAWVKHQQDSQYLGPPPRASEGARKIPRPYSKADVLEYHELCRAEVEAKVRTLDLGAPSGFSWLPFSKLELQFYNIRHLQHHTGQLADRLRTAVNVGLPWVRPN